MSDDYIEKDLDDQVYEDDYYEEHYDEEELKDSEESFDDDDESGENPERKVNVSYACEDCDYRWEDVLFKRRGEDSDDYEADAVCPMCGSVNVTQI